MSQKFKSEIELQALNNATTDTDKILVSDGGVIKYRTGEQVRSDIGAQAALTNPITGTGTTNRLPKFTGATSLGDSQIFDNGTNIGIGTTSPSTKLEIDTNSVNAGQVRLTNSSQTNQYLSINVNGTNGSGISGWDNSSVIEAIANSVGSGTRGLVLSSYNGPTIFQTGTNRTERIRITTAGNVGIGTTSPGVALHIARAGEVALDLQDTLGQNYRFFSRNSDKTLGIFDVTNGRTFFRHVGNATVGSTRLSLMENGGNVFIGNTADQTGCLTQIQRTGSSRLLSLFNTTAQGGAKIEFFDGTSNGAVGNLGGNLIFYVNSRDTERMRIDSSGNVGIGVSTMGGRLNIAGSSSDAWASANGGLTLNGNSSGGISTITTFLDASSIRIGAGTTQKTGILITGQSSASGSTVQFSTGASERMRITGTGNVGIGTSNPTNKLQVNGTVSFSDGFTEIYAGSGESYMASYNTGAYFYTGLDGTGFADTAIMGSKNTYTSDDVVLGVQGADASGNQDFLTSRNLLKESGPINPDSPVMWIKIFNQNDGGTYFIPAYQ
jgi:hypothetical protein